MFSFVSGRTGRSCTKATERTRASPSTSTDTSERSKHGYLFHLFLLFLLRTFLFLLIFIFIRRLLVFFFVLFFVLLLFLIRFIEFWSCDTVPLEDRVELYVFLRLPSLPLVLVTMSSHARCAVNGGRSGRKIECAVVEGDRPRRSLPDVKTGTERVVFVRARWEGEREKWKGERSEGKRWWLFFLFVSLFQSDYCIVLSWLFSIHIHVHLSR